MRYSRQIRLTSFLSLCAKRTTIPLSPSLSLDSFIINREISLKKVFLETKKPTFKRIIFHQQLKTKIWERKPKWSQPKVYEAWWSLPQLSTNRNFKTWKYPISCKWRTVEKRKSIDGWALMWAAATDGNHCCNLDKYIFPFEQIHKKMQRNTFGNLDKYI